jgi:hypothetical protein
MPKPKHTKNNQKRALEMTAVIFYSTLSTAHYLISLVRQGDDANE